MIMWSCPCSALEKYKINKTRAKRKKKKLKLRPTKGLFSAEDISRAPKKKSDYNSARNKEKFYWTGITGICLCELGAFFFSLSGAKSSENCRF
jgi:hypothetical protein